MERIKRTAQGAQQGVNMFGLSYIRIAIALAAVAAIAGAAWKIHHTGVVSGRAEVQAAWDADIALRTAAALKASEQARATEQVLQTKVLKVSNDYAKSQKAHAVAVASANDELRQLQAVLARPDKSSADSTATTGAYGTGGLERDILGDCAKTVVQLAITADRLEGKVVGLQDYIRSVAR